ncbi:fibronectin type III domain-containing protein [Cerasicoccus frondis]|uniref:fibronectin type III domain-containing protein n=1 Tax=Cerasicoccus frondis TaxID=490090 RepID=UPI0028529469|nr:fibronectin type III domain-containing protein [Cerasicoccus frondis]
MRKQIALVLGLLGMLLTTEKIAHAENQYLVSSVDGGMPYLLHVPDEYDENPDKYYPTIIYLHGYGERCQPSSYGTTDELSSLENASAIPPRLVRDGYPMSAEIDGETEYFIIISPQIRSNRGHWNASDVVGLLDEVSESVRIDSTRVYLTGFSFGGTGVWRVLGESANEPNRFAAAAPVCGWNNVSSSYDTIANHRVAIWAFSGLSDTTEHTPERILVSNRELRERLPEADHLVTMYAGVGHSSSRPYNTGNYYHDPNLYQWFLQHTLQESGPVIRTNFATDAQVVATAGDVMGSYDAGRVKSNQSTFWASDTDDYNNKWVMLDLGAVRNVDQIYLRFGSSTSSSLQPVSPSGAIDSVEASSTSGRIRIYAPDHARRSGSGSIPAHQIWVKDTDGYDGGPYTVRKVNSSSSSNPDGWFEIDGDFTDTSTGTWYTLNQTIAAYEVECSLDGETWTLLADEDDNYEFNRQHKFVETAMRYVRVNVQRANRMDLPEFEHEARIYEMQVLEAATPVDLPEAPIGFSTDTITSGGAALIWDAVDGVVAGYHLYWSTDGIMPSEPSASLGSAETTFIASGLMPDTEYTFWLTAFNSTGESEPASISFTTLELQPPASPGSLQATGVGATALTLSWDDLADNEEGYLVYYSVSDSQPADPQITLPADSTSCFIEGLSASTTYYFWVLAENEVGQSAVAQTSVTTAEPLGDLGIGLLSYWKLDEESGSSVFDTQGLADGALAGDATRIQDGVSEGGVQLAGDNDWIEIPHRDEYSGEAMSVSMWIRPESVDDQPRGIISKRAGTASTQKAFGIFSYARGELYIDVGSARDDTDYFLEASTEWRHLALVFDGSIESGDNTWLYLDGVAIYSGAFDVTSVPNLDCPITLGILNTNYGNGFMGDIDEVRIYSRALSQLEVEYLAEVPEPDYEGYESWLTEYLSGVDAAEQGMLADADGDGVINLLEYALMTDPTSGAREKPIEVVTVEDDGQRYFAFAYRRLAGGAGDDVDGYSVGGVVYQLLVSSSLGASSWASGSGYFELSGEPVDHGDGSETVILQSLEPITNEAPLFLKLSVTAAE